ncbi:MAG: ABC transporter ATP-binding protein [Candidatus Saccharimonadales bacterium]
MTKQPDKSSVARFYWRHVTRYRGLTIGALLSIPVTVLINGYLPPLVLASVLNRLATHRYDAHEWWGVFGASIITYAILLLAGMVMWRVIDYFVWRLEMNIQRDLAEEVFDHMLRESADFHANNFTGSLVSQNSKLLGGYIRVADTSFFGTLPLIAGIMITTIILAPKAPLYVTCLVIFSILYIILALVIAKPVRKLGAKYAAAESKQTGFLADAITNAMAIKSFARGDYERRRFAKTTRFTEHTLRNFAHAHQRHMNFLGTLTRTISASALAIAVVSVVVYHVNISVMFLILTYTMGIVEQLFQFGFTGLRNYNRALGDAADMVDILSQSPSVVDPVAPEISREPLGTITFDNVQFAHSGSDDAIFNGLSVDIKKGEKIGLVGHSGSGKTTFTRLLLRFSDIQGGEIRIDDQNIAKITQDDLHAKIAYVPQEPLLFHRTISENIGYGAADSDSDTIEDVAKLAHAAEFIDTLPQGYDTLVGERGVKLSGGQRQRVAIARAMLKNAPILVLDEATSALDSESEVLIQDALWKLMEGRTAIVIAHRLSTIQKMDRIVVMDNGRIVETGNHKALLRKKNGIYAKLWAHQSGGFIED